MNLIFDLGGVVVEWNPQAICAQAFDDPALRQAAMTHILQHPDWLALDRGSLAREDAIQRAATRTAWSPTAVADFFDTVLATLRLKGDTVALMQRMHAAGHSLYCPLQYAAPCVDLPGAGLHILGPVQRSGDFLPGWHVQTGTRYLRPSAPALRH